MKMIASMWIGMVAAAAILLACINTVGVSSIVPEARAEPAQQWKIQTKKDVTTILVDGVVCKRAIFIVWDDDTSVTCVGR